MRFLVGRTGQWSGEAKPCEEAYRGEYTTVDRRTVDAPEKVPAMRRDPQEWYSKGTNHRVIDGNIVRDFQHKGWFVEISSLQELLDFIARHGEIVISPVFKSTDEMSIEIYNDYDSLEESYDLEIGE